MLYGPAHNTLLASSCGTGEILASLNPPLKIMLTRPHVTGQVKYSIATCSLGPVHSSDDKSLLAKGVQRTQSSLSHVTYTTRASLIPLLSFLTVPEISNRYAEMHASWLAE